MSLVTLTMHIVFEEEGGPDYAATYNRLRKQVVKAVLATPSIRHLTTGEPHLQWLGTKTYRPKKEAEHGTSG